MKREEHCRYENCSNFGIDIEKVQMIFCNLAKMFEVFMVGDYNQNFKHRRDFLFFKLFTISTRVKLFKRKSLIVNVRSFHIFWVTETIMKVLISNIKYLSPYLHEDIQKI